MADYSNERGDPTTASCGGDYRLLFDAYYLKLLRGAGVVQAWHARSGKRGEDGLFDYTQERQRIAKTGPIPEGRYWIRPSQMTWVIFGRSGWGKYRITIHPHPSTETFGRGGFFIHGGDVWGSAGCIDLTYGMESFTSKMKELDSEDCYVPLTVVYANVAKIPQPD